MSKAYTILYLIKSVIYDGAEYISMTRTLWGSAPNAKILSEFIICFFTLRPASLCFVNMGR